MSTLHTERLTLAYDQAVIIEGMDVTIPSGRITALVGPNGCGKSTLLRGLARLLAPKSGAAYLDGKPIHQMPTRALATRLGILPQSPTAPEGLTVRELVAQGRYPHQSWLQQWAAGDEAAVSRALELTGMAGLADRPVDALSGGQRQRAWIAMTLAQETPVILLDEPTTYLDLSHQIEVLQLLERLNRDEGRTIVMVVHDLNHATRHAQHVIALRAGRVVAAGPPAQVVTPELLRAVFGVEGAVVADPRTGLPLCIAYGLVDAPPGPAPGSPAPEQTWRVAAPRKAEACAAQMPNTLQPGGSARIEYKAGARVRKQGPMTEAFPEKFVAGVVAHINADHRGEMLELARGLAGKGWASDAELLHADPRGIDLLLSAAGREERWRLPFDTPLEHPRQFRPALIGLIGRARAQMGAPDLAEEESQL